MFFSTLSFNPTETDSPLDAEIVDGLEAGCVDLAAMALNVASGNSAMVDGSDRGMPGVLDSGESSCPNLGLPPAVSGDRPWNRRKASLGFTLLETLIAFLLSSIGVSILYGSLNGVGKNSLDAMNRQGGAAVVESAHESVKRINNVSQWIRLDTTWTESQQNVDFRVHAVGSAVDSNTTTANCAKPGAASRLLAKVTYSVSRAATGTLARDSFTVVTMLSQQ